jgi:hypothetical protein
MSQYAKILKNKEKLNPVERATLRYGMSRIIDLSAHMQAWFSDIDIQHMMRNHAAVLMVPALDEEVNTFITDIEKVLYIYNIYCIMYGWFILRRFLFSYIRWCRREG